RQAGKAGPTSNIGDQLERRVAAQRVETREAVGQVGLERLTGVSHRGRCVRSATEQLEERGEPLLGALGQAPSCAQLFEPFHGKRGESSPTGYPLRRRGVMTILRNGSSPSLCVSTSGRSFRYMWTTLRSAAAIESSSTARP